MIYKFYTVGHNTYFQIEGEYGWDEKGLIYESR